MAIVTETRDFLRNGGSAVRSAVARGEKAARRLSRSNTPKLLKQVSSRFAPRRAHRQPVPVARLLVASAVMAVGATVSAIMVRRFLAARNADKENAETIELTN
jgi:hypothetical protein